MSQTCRASWLHIQQLWENEQARCLRFCPKLTQSHIEPGFGQKMNVGRAAETLSHSVASAIQQYCDKGEMPAEARQTAEFIDRVDKLFDRTNSAHTSQRGNKSPVTAGSLASVCQLFENDIEWVRQWVFQSRDAEKNNTKTSLPFKKGLLVTLSALRALSEFLIVERQFHYVCTRRFTQDCLENLFSIIRRGRGGLNHHPESQSAIQILRLATCSQLFDSISKGSNCESTSEDVLLTIGKFCILANRN